MRLESAPAPGGLLITTFHELCLTLGREAGTLPPEPAEKTQEWWDEVLPRALDHAIPLLGGRYHAIVVDEGQDFARDWLDSLYLMLTRLRARRAVRLPRPRAGALPRRRGGQ